MVKTAMNYYEWYGFEVNECQTQDVVQLINTSSDIHESSKLVWLYINYSVFRILSMFLTSWTIKNIWWSTS